MLSKPAEMHIPDGFLSIGVSIVMWVIALVFIAQALRKVNKTLGERQVPLMGVLAACIFAGQMLNFTVAGGTSGHLMGAALATILLGPWASVLVLTCVVSVQALLFQDGGLLALGSNIVNMGVVGSFVAFGVFTLIKRLLGERKIGVFASGFAAGWTSIVVAALGVALQLALSGTTTADIAVPTMGLVHMLIGIGEGLITVGALAVVFAARPDLVSADAPARGGNRGIVVGGLVIAALLAIASPLASAFPDGLEWVAAQQGFLDKAQGPAFQIIPAYVVPGIQNEAAATILAGLIGMLIVLGAALGLAYARRKRSAGGASGHAA